MTWTYQDSVDSLVDFLGGGPSDQVARSCRQAVGEAYREMTRSQRWPYLYHHGRIITTAPFDGSVSDGSGNLITPAATMQYTHTGGAYERMAVISGGTWPAFAAACYLRIADTTGSTSFVAYRVAQRISATTIILDPAINPGADIPAGTTFLLYQDTYLLPADYIAQDEALYELNFGGMQYTHPRDWLYENRYVLAEGIPQFFTITGDPQYPGRLVMRLFPWPSDVRSVDFIYQRSPRPLVFQQFSGGTVSVTQGGESITGVGTAFTAAMVGSTIRVSGNARSPSGPLGSVGGYNPPSLEATITAWVSPTSLGIDTPSPSALTGVNYYVSDPIDFEQGAMLNAFLRCSEKCLASSRSMKNLQATQQNYRVALEEARAASSPSFAGRHAGPISRYKPRLRDYPQGPDEP